MLPQLLIECLVGPGMADLHTTQPNAPSLACTPDPESKHQPLEALGSKVGAFAPGNPGEEYGPKYWVEVALAVIGAGQNSRPGSEGASSE